MMNTRDFLVWFKQIPKPLIYTCLLPLPIILSAMQILALTPLQDFIDQKTFHPFAFQIRNMVLPETIDPRIKVFAFDDRTVAATNAQDISLADWANVIVQLSQKKNVHILIDKLFDKPYPREEITSFRKKLTEPQSDVTVIAFAHPDRITYRENISDEDLKLNQNKTIEIKNNQFTTTNITRAKNIYGATQALLQSFTKFGVANYSGNNMITPFLLTESQKVVPHAAIAAAGRLVIDNGLFSMNGKPIPVNQDGNLLVNLHSKSLYQKRTYSLLAVIERAKKGQDISIVEPGDYVVILPGMFTGSTDFAATPFGSMPGGFISVATLHSALTGHWIQQVKDPGFFVLCAGFLGFMTALRLMPAPALLAMVVSGSGLISISTLLFIYSAVAVSFVTPLCGLFIGTIFGVVISSSIRAIEDMRRKRELEVASVVQKTFFSKNKLENSLVSVAGHFSPASECGGDWWGCFSRNDYSYIMIGDALGHGVPAALMTATIFAAIQILEDEFHRDSQTPLLPSEILKKLNKVVHSMNSVYITFQIFRFNDATSTCLFSNAGHCPPIIIPIDNSDSRLPKGRRGKMIIHSGNVLGSDIVGNFTDHEIMTQAGDRILLYSDGLIENKAANRNSSGGKLWLTNTLRIIDDKKNERLLDIIWDAYLKRIGEVQPEDDVTLVAIDLKNFKT